MREFRLLALAGAQAGTDVPDQLVQLTEILGEHYAAARERPDRDVDEALDRGDDTLDLVYEVPASAGDGLARLEQLMNEADTFCASEQLMSLERPPTVKRFEQWYLSQFVTQIAGGEPTPWDGPLDP